MTDAAVNLTAVDTFSLGGSFIPQNTTKTISQDHAEMIKANGDYEKYSDVFNVLNTYSASYKFNADTGLGAALPAIGEVKNAIMIDSISISTSYNDYPEISIEGHQHGENAHADDRVQYSIPAGIQTILTGAYGAYDFFSKSSATVCSTDSSYTIQMTHVDVECGTGDHFVGDNILGNEEASVTYVGDAATPTTVSGWTVTSAEESENNQEFDVSTISASRVVARD